MNRSLPVLIFAMGYPTVMACIYFWFMAGGKGEANPGQQLGYSLGKLFQFVFPVLLVWWATGQIPLPRKPVGDGMLFGLIFGLGISLLMFGLYFFFLRDSTAFAGMPELIREKLNEFGLQGLLPYVLFAIFISLVHSLLEEYYWRWFVFHGLRKTCSFGLAAALSSLAFMAHHVIVLWVYLPGNFWTLAVPLSLCIAVGGAVWAWMYEGNGNIYAIWLSHGLIDAAIFTIGYDLIQR